MIDRITTQLQESGQASLVGTLAEALAACDNLGLDPRHVIVYGRLKVEKRAEALLADTRHLTKKQGQLPTSVDD